MTVRGRPSMWVREVLKPSYPAGLHEMKREESGKSKKEEEEEVVSGRKGEMITLGLKLCIHH